MIPEEHQAGGALSSMGKSRSAEQYQQAPGSATERKRKEADRAWARGGVEVFSLGPEL